MLLMLSFTYQTFFHFIQVFCRKASQVVCAASCNGPHDDLLLKLSEGCNLHAGKLWVIPSPYYFVGDEVFWHMLGDISY
jgi:hypothetical protein